MRYFYSTEVIILIIKLYLKKYKYKYKNVIKSIYL